MFKLLIVTAAVLAAVSFRPVEGAPSLKEYGDYAASHDGNAGRGRLLFLSEAKGACFRCHTVDGSASAAGPDLQTAGDKFPRRELIRAILEPSAEIAIGYGTTLVETSSGEEIAGIIKEAGDAGLVLKTADGQSVRFPAREIKSHRGSNISLMPEGLQNGLTAEEFSDLVEYLVSLKQPANALGSNRGMPEEIPELANPVELRPFLSEALSFPHAFVQKPGDIRSGLVYFAQIPGAPNSFLGVHQAGKVWLIDKDPAGDLQKDRKALFGDFGPELFNERGPNGLLGLAFHPKFRENGKYYLKHQVFEEGKIATVLVEKRASPDLRRDSGRPSRRLLKIVSTTQDHSGGCVQFGPDGYLYLGMGDTGPQQDPQGHGQDLQTLLGKMLRLDVDHASTGLPYAIPSDNPFRNRSDARPEIWALGFREPWRFSFDTATGELWVGDVGQDRVEEVSVVRKGENHGWNVFEGFEPFSNRYRREGTTYVPPVFAYKRKFGNSITGGYIYRADKTSTFYGVYVCGDYTSKRVWALTSTDRTLDKVRQIANAPQNIASFANDELGNIYVVGYEGMVYKIDFATAIFE